LGCRAFFHGVIESNNTPRKLCVLAFHPCRIWDWNRPASPRTPGHGAWGRDQAPRREKGESVAYCSSGARVACTTGKVTSCSFRAYVWPAIPTVSHDLPPTALALAAVPWLSQFECEVRLPNPKATMGCEAWADSPRTVHGFAPRHLRSQLRWPASIRAQRPCATTTIANKRDSAPTFRSHVLRSSTGARRALCNCPIGYWIHLARRFLQD
jgi:hypothetical protein